MLRLSQSLISVIQIRKLTLLFALYFPQQCLQQFLLLEAALLMQDLADNSCYTCFQLTSEMELSNEMPGL